MRAAALGLLLLAAPALSAKGLADLPAWAQEAAMVTEKAPAEADAWVLLDRTEFEYERGGELVSRHFRLVRILGQRGLAEGRFTLYQEGGEVHTIRRLKGWNLRPDGEVVKLARSDIKILDPDRPGTVTTGTLHEADLDRVEVGSLVAFEAEEEGNYPIGPFDRVWALGTNPVRRWELACAPGRDPAALSVQMTPQHWQEWGITLEPMGVNGLAANHLPSLPRFETGHPFMSSMLPRVLVRYLVPSLGAKDHLASWDTFASWYCACFQEAARPSGKLPIRTPGTRSALSGILDWMNRELVYHIAFLTPERGWLPQSCADVVRRRNGDCKDHAACFLGEAAGAGFEGYPVLCAIMEKEVEAGPVPDPYTFNHAIAAIKLRESLGLPAEVQTPKGRFLLVDATDRYCPFGRLPSAHRKGRVLICTPDGAAWADVPDGAPMVPSLRVDVAGECLEQGRTRARIHLSETANAHALRALALQGGENSLTERFLRAQFQLPANGSLADFAMGDPLDLDHPFEVSFTVNRAGGFTAANGRCRLDPWGLPEALPSIQKPGVPRRYPVEVRRVDLFDYHAVWTIPGPVTPSLPALDVGTAFGDLTWRAEAEGRNVTLDLHLRHKAARFEGEGRAAGVSEWKKLRGILDQVREDGTAFRVSPD